MDFIDSAYNTLPHDALTTLVDRNMRLVGGRDLHCRRTGLRRNHPQVAAPSHSAHRQPVNLGLLFMKGEGVPQDYIQAHMWFNLSASRASGDDRKLYADSRDGVATKMTAAQVGEAQRLAREWKPKT